LKEYANFYTTEKPTTLQTKSSTNSTDLLMKKLKLLRVSINNRSYLDFAPFVNPLNSCNVFIAMP